MTSSLDTPSSEALREAERYLRWPELPPSSRITLLIAQELVRLSASETNAQIVQVLPLTRQPESVTTATPSTGMSYTVPGPWAPQASVPDDKPLQPLKVRTKFLGQGDLYDLYLGDTYLGRFGLDAVVPLANAITNAVSVHPSTPTDKRVSAHDHGNCELCDQLERELAEAQDDCRRLHREKMDALFGPDGKPRSASEPIELLREIQRYLSANKILRPLDWQCRVDAILRAAADSASTKR